MAAINVSGKAHGIGSASGTTQQVFLTTGQAYGVGTLAYDYALLAGGTAAGSTAVYGQIVKDIRLAGLAAGYGMLIASVPLPANGVGVLAGYLDLVRVPCPVCDPDCRQPCHCGCHDRDHDDEHGEHHEERFDPILVHEPWLRPWLNYDREWEREHRSEEPEHHEEERHDDKDDDDRNGW